VQKRQQESSMGREKESKNVGKRTKEKERGEREM
jgi:hypothetical protein